MNDTVSSAIKGLSTSTVRGTRTRCGAAVRAAAASARGSYGLQRRRAGLREALEIQHPAISKPPVALGDGRAARSDEGSLAYRTCPTMGRFRPAASALAVSICAAAIHERRRRLNGDRDMTARAMVALLLAVMLTGLTVLARLSPPDPTWVAGFWDNADYDDVVMLICGTAADLPTAPSSPRATREVVATVDRRKPIRLAFTAVSFVLSRAPPGV